MTQNERIFTQVVMIVGFVVVAVVMVCLWVFPPGHSTKEKPTIYTSDGELKQVRTIHSDKFDVFVQPYKRDSITYLIFHSCKGIYVVNYTDDSLAWVFLHPVTKPISDTIQSVTDNDQVLVRLDSTRYTWTSREALKTRIWKQVQF